jgi:hypothetical protein
MRSLLQRHPDSTGRAVTQIEVAVVSPGGGRLVLSYTVTGRVKDIVMPPLAASERADKLWQHTCFEAFIRASPGSAYHEFNFAPSMHWAAYRFGGYRSDMSEATELGPPEFEVQSGSDRYSLRASLELQPLFGAARGRRWRLGLAAVIEDTDGRKSYWALKHPPGRPDFHHQDCFAHEFSPAELP